MAAKKSPPTVNAKLLPQVAQLAVRALTKLQTYAPDDGTDRLDADDLKVLDLVRGAIASATVDYIRGVK